MPVGYYRHHEILGDAVVDEVQKIAALLADFRGVVTEWAVPMEDRGGDAIKERLHRWSHPERPADTVLYWVGHGWSNGSRAALIHADSPPSVQTWGIAPAELAEPIRARQSNGDRWAMVIIDSCRSYQFVDQVNADFAIDPEGTERILLIGVSGAGATTLGRFSAALEAALRETYGSVDTIDLQDLGRDLERRLGDSLVIPRRIGGAELVRDSAPVAAAMPGPLDVVHELKRALDPLTPAERHHFLAKARGTEEGELAWFFEGRTAEIATIVHWLRTERSGMLVVTGIAGSGKSALLGDTVLQSMPDVRDVLVRGGLMDARAPTLLPPDDCFDEVIHLTGLRMEDVVDRVAAAARLGEPPSRSDHSAHPSTARDIEWMVEQLENREESFTLLLDALDEAVGPLTIAATLLRRLAEIPGVRVVVGTRMSTNDSPDYQASDRNLLDAVGCRAPSDGPGPTELHMSHDSVAVAEYAHHKLTRAISVGRLPDTPQTVAAVESIVEQIRGGDHTFLFARLLVHELIGAPSLLDPARSMTTAKLLGGDHRGVFGAAVTRLSAQADCFLPLLQSLALSHGRGIPIRNGVWATMAMAISGGHSGNTPITDEDISSFLRAAEPYVSIDADAGQTVYRLAHRTFVEHFLSSWGS